MDKKEHKPQVLFKSQQFPAREKEKYFIVETIIPSSHDHRINNNSNSNNNNGSNTNLVEGPIDVFQKVGNETNKLIETKKLQFNDIWTNKITQEDLYVPKTILDMNSMQALNRILFNSIIKYASKINDLFILLSQEKEGVKILEYSNSILIISLALHFKMRNFLQVKGSALKYDSNTLMPLSKVIQWYKCLNEQLEKDTMVQINELITFFNDFKNEISN